MDPAVVVIFLFGAALGTCVGILTAALTRIAARPIDVFTRSDVTSAYLVGWQDGMDGLGADTTRSAPLYDWEFELNEGRRKENSHG